MKKSILIAAVIMLAGTATVSAQGGGGFQRRTVEERVKMIHEKLDSAFKLAPDVMTKVDETFKDYYTTQDKAREDMRASGNMDRDAMRSKMQEMTEARDEKLKKILTEDQYKTFKDKIEPSMRPQRPGGPGGN